MSNNPSDQSLFAASVKAIAAVAALRCAGLANAFRQIGMVADLVTAFINDELPHGAVACEKPANMASDIR
jgi:hypothetical protein